jgi:hypothetical protein
MMRTVDGMATARRVRLKIGSNKGHSPQQLRVVAVSAASATTDAVSVRTLRYTASPSLLP